MHHPFVSIIVPVYNVEQYLHECVPAIIAQTCGDWELILIDDGSPDGCPQICDEYALKDKRITVIHQHNQGVAVARNAGLDVARGEWIWFVDSDDWIDENAISILCRKIRGEEDLIMFGYVRHENGRSIVCARTETDELCKNDFLYRQATYYNSCMFFKRTIIEKYSLRFSIGVRLAEDLEFQYKYEMLCQHPVSISDSLYHYRIREGSVTHNETYRKNAVEDLLLVLKNLYDFIIDHGAVSEVWIDKRLEMLMKNLLYSASLVKDLKYMSFQNDIRRLICMYREMEFTCFDGIKIRLAYYNVKLYFIMNKIWLKLKGVK